MKAITTKYIPATFARGARVSANDEDGNKAISPWDHSIDPEENHARAARKLCEKMKWTGAMQGGFVKGGMVWVWIHPRIAFTV